MIWDAGSDVSTAWETYVGQWMRGVLIEAFISRDAHSLLSDMIDRNRVAAVRWESEKRL